MSENNFLFSNNKRRKDILKEKLNELIDELSYPELCGFMFLLFETDGETIFTIAETQGLVSPNDIIAFLDYFKIVNKIGVNAYYFKPSGNYSVDEDFNIHGENNNQ